MTERSPNRLYYAYARHALVTALRLARVQHGSKVLIPEFICRDVLASLRAVGAEPLFYEIDDTLQPRVDGSLQSTLGADSQQVAAVMVVNYFGFPAHLDLVKRLLHAATLPIIEDNAHGWLSADEHGTTLGSRTQFGITSVRKTIRIPDGAYLEWRDDGNLDTHALHEPLEPRDHSLPASFRIRRAVSRIDARSPIAVMPLTRGAVRLLRLLGGKPSVDLHTADEWDLPTNRNPHQYSLQLMGEVDQGAEVARRRAHYQRCEALAAAHDIARPFASLPPNVSPQGFPFFWHPERAEAFCAAVQRVRLGEVIAWPSLPSRTSLAEDSRLRSLHLVNFLV